MWVISVGISSDSCSVNDDGKPLKSCKSALPSSFTVVSKKVDDPINEDSDSEVFEVYNETANFMVSTSSKDNKASKSCSGVRNKSLYEQCKKTYDEDPYDDDDDCVDPSLIDAQMQFTDDFAISFHSQLR